METNFFSQIENLLNGQDLSIIIKKKGDQLTVGVFPKPRVDDPIKNEFPSLQLVGTTSEMDQNFINHVKQPLQHSSEWATNTQSFEEKMARIKQESQQAAEEKKEKQQRLYRIKEILKEANSLIADKNFAGAASTVKRALNLDPDNKESLELQTKINNLSGTPGLFA